MFGMFKRKKVTVESPTWQDISVGVSIGKKTLNLLEMARKLFWNVVNIVCNARSIWRTLVKTCKEVCYA